MTRRIARLLAAAAALVAGGAAAGQEPPPRVLFIGNSFTQGAHSPVQRWRPGDVTDLNGGGTGGVPALFRHFARASGLDYRVSLELEGGKTLGFHHDRRRRLIDRPWDVVVLQELSILSPDRPGDDTAYRRDVARLAALLRARNPAVRIWLMATWTRADQTYRPEGRWYGRPVAAMADDLRAAADRARAEVPGIAGVLPVGQAWTRAMATGVADPDPYDGRAAGQVNLWTGDHYHGSAHGYYLEALVVFGRITGVDPLTLGAGEGGAGEGGAGEGAAAELGLSAADAAALQRVASDELAAEALRPAVPAAPGRP